MSATGVLTRALDKGPERRRDPDRDFLGLAAGERGGGGGGGGCQGCCSTVTGDQQG